MPCPSHTLPRTFSHRHAAVALGLAFALSFGSVATPAKAASKDDTLESVIRLVQERYVKPISREKAVDMALSGLMLMLDDHSSFLTPKELLETQQQISGHYGGIGIRTERREGAHYVIEVGENTPASKAGLQVGDRVLAVAGLDTATLTETKLVEHVRGKPGTAVRVEWLHEDETIVAPMRREEITTPTAKRGLLPSEARSDTLMIRLTRFSATTPMEIQKLLAAETPGLKRLILDLRGNPGGSVKAAVDVASLFLPPERVVLRVRSRDKADEVLRTSALRRIAAGRRNWLQDTPIAVLIDGESASAAEILAGALRDHGRATLVGERNSFGKGTIQRLFELDGERAVKMTVAQYVLPGGDPVDKIGVAPQVWVSAVSGETAPDTDTFSRTYSPAKSDAVLEAALQTLSEQAANRESTHAEKDTSHDGSDHAALRGCRLGNGSHCQHW